MKTTGRSTAKAWNGTGAYTYDRIGRGTLHIRAACVSVLGGIQPGPLERYLREVFGGHGDDGLLQRFQLAVWPDGGGRWRNVDRWPDADARTRVVEVFQRLNRLDSARDFLAAEPEGRTAVALVDIKMEGMTGFELQEELAARHSAIPLIFITAFDDAATRDRIRRTGWECLVKPFEEEVLLGAVGRVRKPV